MGLSRQKSNIKKIRNMVRIKLFALSLCFAVGLSGADARTSGGKLAKVGDRNEFRVGYSDGLTLAAASFWGIGLGDALTGTTRSDEVSTGVFGVGYRYAFGRFRVGADLGFAQVTSKVTRKDSKVPDMKETQLNFLVMPAAEMVYFKHGIVELYGSVATGVDITRTSEKGLTEAGSKMARAHAGTETGLAFQVNPIAVRVGNDRIGGFLETGLGYKGFLTAGVSLRF